MSLSTVTIIIAHGQQRPRGYGTAKWLKTPQLTFGRLRDVRALDLAFQVASSARVGFGEARTTTGSFSSDLRPSIPVGFRSWFGEPSPNAFLSEYQSEFPKLTAFRCGALLSEVDSPSQYDQHS